MIKAVVKHSYVKGATGKARGWAHLKYIQFRSKDEEREKDPRRFFNEEREDIRGSEIKRLLDEQERYGVQMHKLILSPGVQGTDLAAYTRETMDALEREKGQNLAWYGVIHRNTDHDHIHVVVMGRDKDGGRVRIDRDDYKELRAAGDRYLAREHQLDRYLDREIDRLLASKDWKHDRGDAQFERLMSGDKDEKHREARDAERDRRAWDEFDRDLHKQHRGKQDRGTERSKGYKQWNIEQAGRLSDWHEHATNQAAKKYWQELSERDPEMAAAAARELNLIEKLEQESQMSKHNEVDLDKLLDGMDPWERELKRDWEREMKELAGEQKILMPDQEMSNELKKELREGGLSWLFGGSSGDTERDDGREAMETDRQVREEQKGREEEPERDERDRRDDLDRGR